MIFFRKKLCNIKIFSFLFLCFFINVKLFSQGIPIEKIQNDPYFTSGSAFAPEESNEESNQESAKKKLQMTDPSDSSTFYNAENWPGGIKDFNEESSNKEELSESEDSKNKNPERNKESNKAQGSDKKTEADKNQKPVLEADSKSGINGAFNPKNAKFNISASYKLFYSPAFIKESFPSYFDKAFGFNFAGANATVEYLLSGKKDYKISFAAYASYSLLNQSDYKYTLRAQQFNAGGLIQLKFFTHNSDQINIHAGAGFLYIKDLQYTYENNLSSDSTDWCYPELRLGFDYEYFIYDYIGFKTGADFVWPLFLDKFYPMLDVKAGLITRF